MKASLNEKWFVFLSLFKKIFFHVPVQGDFYIVYRDIFKWKIAIKERTVSRRTVSPDHITYCTVCSTKRPLLRVYLGILEDED